MEIGEYYSIIFSTASIVGGIAFALSGFLTGVRKRLDLMGLLVLAFLTANGGGIIRDLMVRRMPAVMIGMKPFWLTAGTVAMALALRLQRRDSIERNRIFVLSDAVGLAAFGITGALVGIEHGLHFFGVVTLSFLTATGGGILRDILVNEIPLVLHEDFYGTVAILIGVAIHAIHLAGATGPMALSVVFASGVFVRLVAQKRQWSLPKVR